MSLVKSAYAGLMDTINQLQMVKKAGAGFDSTFPPNLPDNGTQDPSTGSFFKELTEGVNNAYHAPNAQNTSGQGLDSDGQGDNSKSDFGVGGCDTWRDAEDECKTYPDDPGTSFDEVDASNQDMTKESAYDAFSFEENVNRFLKSAAQAQQLAYQARYSGNYASFPFTKRALDEGASPDEVAESAAIESLPDSDVAALGEMSDGDLASIASAAEDEGSDPEVEAVVDQLASLPDEELIPVIQELAASADNGGCDPVTGECSEEEKEAGCCKKAFYSLHPYDQQALLKASSADLNNLIVKCAEGIEDAQAEEAIASDPQVAEAVQTLQDLPQEDLDIIDSMSPEELDAAIAELESAAAEEQIASDPELAPEAAAIDSLTEKEAAYLGNMDDDNLTNLFYKCAEELEGMAAEDAVDASAEDEALASLPPEAQEAMASLTPEEQEAVLQDAAAVLSGEVPIEEVLGDSGSPEDNLSAMAESPEVTPEEGIQELSAAMDEQGITPEQLASMDKTGSYRGNGVLYKYASAVQQLRNSGYYRYAPPATQKRAAIRQTMHGFLSEARSRAGRYLNEITR